jgi:hypothetical protein
VSCVCKADGHRKESVNVRLMSVRFPFGCRLIVARKPGESRAKAVREMSRKLSGFIQEKECYLAFARTYRK